MLEIKENQELDILNLLSYRGKVSQAEFESIGKEMEKYIQETGAKRAGNPITATYAVEGEIVDMEILIPIDKKIEAIGKFAFKNQIKITNAVVASYTGHPMGLQDACMQLNQYIMDNKLQPLTVGYNVTKKTDMLSPEQTEIDVYVGINQNIL